MGSKFIRFLQLGSLERKTHKFWRRVKVLCSRHKTNIVLCCFFRGSSGSQGSRTGDNPHLQRETTARRQPTAMAGGITGDPGGNPGGSGMPGALRVHPQRRPQLLLQLLLQTRVHQLLPRALSQRLSHRVPWNQTIRGEIQDMFRLCLH